MRVWVRHIVLFTALLLPASHAEAAGKARPVFPPHTAFILPARLVGGPTQVVVLAREVLGGIVPTSEVQYVVAGYRPGPLTYIVYVYSTEDAAVTASRHLSQPGWQPLKVKPVVGQAQRGYEDPVTHACALVLRYDNLMFTLRTGPAGSPPGDKDLRRLLGVAATLVSRARSSAHAF